MTPSRPRLTTAFIVVGLVAIASRGAPAPKTGENVQAATTESLDVRVEATGELLLTVKIRSRATAPMEIYRSDLPWGSVSSLLLVAVKADASGSIVDRRNAIDDPSPTRVVLKPAEELTGTIDLLDQFPNLRGSSTGEDVIVFWSYQPKLVGGEVLPRCGGWLALDLR